MNTNFAICIGSYGSYHITDEPLGLTIGNFNIEIPDPPATPRKPRLSDFPVDVSPALPWCFMEDNDMPLKEHQAIMVPNNGMEGIFGIAEHLGEGQRCIERFVEASGKAYHNESRGQLLLPITTGLTNLEKIIYHEAGMTAQGEPVLPHEVHSARPWYRFAGGIRKKFGCTAEQAETLEMAFQILDTTEKMANTFAKWLTPEKFDKGYIYFQDLAKQMVLVTDEGEPRIVTTTLEEPEDDEQEISADNPAEIPEVVAEGWHKLDDPRDDEKPWEDRQPMEFRKVLAQIRGCKKLADLKVIGKSLFNRKDFNKTQTSVIWGVYHNRKFALEPKLRPVATAILKRLADPDVNLAKAAFWLNGEGKKALTQHELSVVWKAWKKVRQAKPTTKKLQADLDLSPPDGYPEELAKAEEPDYLYDE